YSEGLHQALEATESVTVQNENQTLDSITFQNYFRLYPKLAGMTGTAMTESQECSDIYKPEVIESATTEPGIRDACHDEVYRAARISKCASGPSARRSRRRRCARRGPPRSGKRSRGRTKMWSRRAGSLSSAASGTRAGASTTSCAAARAARATPAPPNSSSRW